jgi:DNA-binding transcriptional MerR regulator
MRIGELADAAGVNTKTVRYYESIDLMPEPDRTPAGYRNYSPDAFERLRFIRDSQSTGLTLADRATNLDPTACTDPNRCQVIDTHRHPPTP